MNCPECKQEFDEISHVPRILTACGHTICEICLKLRYKKKNIICPQCSVATIAQNLNILPSNLALIQLKQNKISQDLCSKHNKPIEAFCCNDKLLVCVICLLEDGHKTHELATVPKAVKKYKDLLNNYRHLANTNQESIIKETKDIQEKHNLFSLTYNKLAKDFIIVFEIIKKVLIDKEIQIKEKLKKTLDYEIEVLNTRNLQFIKNLQNIEAFHKELEISEHDNDIDFINNFTKREELAKSVTSKIQPLNKIDPFLAFSVEAEINAIIKLIQSKFFQKPETKSVTDIKKKPTISKESQLKGKFSVKPSNKTIPKPTAPMD